VLATAFLEAACRSSAREVMRISEGAMAVLHSHDWPGNVRELKNLMRYLAATVTQDELRADHVRGQLVRSRAVTRARVESSSVRWRPLAEEVRELEITRIREALEATQGNITRAAQLVAVPMRTFFEKVNRLGLHPKRRRDDG
jgi:DNA-binding NtrC family response regulator